MKKLFVVLFVFVAVSAFGQTVIFEDDFEGNLSLWTLEADPAASNTWDIVDAESHSPSHSLTESPTGDYSADVTYTATIAAPLDLSTVVEANLNFWMKYDIEGGLFDFLYIDVSPDNGVSWVNIGTYYGEDMDWAEYTISLGGFAGNANVLLRWQIVTDGGYEVNGMYLDDVVVTTSDVDNTSPLILYDGPEYYEGPEEDFIFEAEIIDISGIASADVTYTIEGGAEITLPSTGNAGDMYSFTIPFSAYGDQIDFKVVATDASANSNTGETVISSLIFGHHLIYDTGVVDFYIAFVAGTGAAVKMLNPAGMDLDLKYAFIRNYIDSTLDNDDMEFHIWSDAGGVPGEDLITPFMVTPEATVDNNSPMTRVDLRSYSAELSNVQGDFFIGFMVPAGNVHCTESSPGSFGQSYVWNGSAWAEDAADFHFRAVVELYVGNDPGTVEGTVTDTDTGSPIAGAIIVMGAFSASTDANGEYSISVSPGLYDVEFSAPGYESYTFDDLAVASNDMLTLDASLQHLYNPPTALTYQFTSPNIILQWDAPEGMGLTGFEVYRNDALLGTSNPNVQMYLDANVPAGDYTYYILAVYGDYESVPSNEIDVNIAAGSDDNTIPRITALAGNHPNPFNPSTAINYSVAEAGNVTLEIYNTKGARVAVLQEGFQQAGFYSAAWNGKDISGNSVAGGVYFYKMKTGEYTCTKKMLLLK
jgi:hypothetical protein